MMAEMEHDVNQVLTEGRLTYLLQHARVRQGYPMRQMGTNRAPREKSARYPSEIAEHFVHSKYASQQLP